MTDRDREAFEAWLFPQCSERTHPLWTERRGESYAHPVTRGSWEGWQAALAHAREAGAQEPVAWLVQHDQLGPRLMHHRPAYIPKSEWNEAYGVTPLYTHPAPAQEPVAVPAPRDDFIWKVAKFFDEDLTAGSFLREDGEGGFIGGIYRMAREIERLRNLSAAPVPPPAEPTPDLVETVATGRDGVQRRVYVDRARGVVMEASPPAESGEVEDPWREAGEKQVQVHEALQDSAYRAGARAGWNAQFADEPDAAIERLTRYPKGALSIIHEKRAYEKITSSNPPAAKTGVVKLLDMSNLLKHAWQAGKNGVEWVDYDPDDTPAYGRISSALASHTPAPPQPGETSTDCRTEQGVTVSLIDSIITAARVLADRPLDPVPVREALKDLQADADVRKLFPQPGGAVKVKALTWKDGPSHSGMQVAECVFGEYWAWDAGSGCWSRGSLPGRLVSGGMKGAQAAAQADYERAILSALEPSPSQWNAGAEAMREACAAAIGPVGERPCDCERCDCRNRDDAERVARWDEAKACAEVIRALPLPTPPAGEG